MHRALILALTLALAAEAAGMRIVVRVPEGVSLSRDKAEESLSGIAPAGTGRYDALEIVIYHYSQGAETISYTDADTMSASAKKGGIKALIKCRKNGLLARSIFVEAEGADEDRILENFRRAVADAIGGL